MHTYGQVMVEEFGADAVHIVAKVPARIAGRLTPYLEDAPSTDR